MRNALAIALGALLLAVSAMAQDVSAGNLSVFFTEGFSPGSGGKLTVLDAGNSASATGNLTTATAAFGGNCSGATFRIRTFRQQSWDGPIQLVAERGPFNAAKGFVTVALDPPIAAKAGDYPAIELTSAPDCSVNGFDEASHTTIVLQSDFTGGPLNSVQVARNVGVFLRLSSASPAWVGVIPGAGITAGAGGSAFNTSFVIANPSLYPANLKFVYHPAGQAGSASDPSTKLSLDSEATSTVDLLQQLGVSSGVGSIDVYSDGPAPVINARIFNTAGNGTNGFSENLVTFKAAGRQSDTLYLGVPADLTKFRMNLGMRSLADGASMICITLDATGRSVGGINRTYAPNTFELAGASSFLSGGAIAAGGSILCNVKTGSAVIFATITDNATNDSAMVMAERR